MSCVLSWFGKWTPSQVSSVVMIVSCRVGLYPRVSAETEVLRDGAAAGGGAQRGGPGVRSGRSGAGPGYTLHELLATCVTVRRVAGEGPDMFECQLKLFSGWWKQWTVEERQSFVQNPDMFK